MSATHYEKHYVLCIEYVNKEGEKTVGRSEPTTRKAAHRKRRAYAAINPGVKCWVEKKPFKLKP